MRGDSPDLGVCSRLPANHALGDPAGRRFLEQRVGCRPVLRTLTVRIQARLMESDDEHIVSGIEHRDAVFRQFRRYRRIEHGDSPVDVDVDRQ